ncbi:MAG: hypothetical protein JW954_05855 [Dehalococcoidaceae bacterium]|nr:hypothetical protein [Dehalococcoidaceae bacterium]
MDRFLAFFIVILLFAALGVHTGCSSAQAEEAPFKIVVVPEQLNGHSIAGQQIVFLVTITDDGKTSTMPVTISASAGGAEISILHADIIEGQVAEVVVIPSQSSVNTSVEVEITGKRGSISDTETFTFDVVEGEDDRGEYAAELKDKFVSWLETNHPELGIASENEWIGTMVSPQWLIVSHYLYFSDEWEMHVSWHIMIAPYDWAKIDLRHRFDETAPSYAFEISSLSGNTAPIVIELPETVWR